MKKYIIYYTAFRGTKYAQHSADTPIIEARDIASAINKFQRMPFHRKNDIVKVEKVI